MSNIPVWLQIFLIIYYALTIIFILIDAGLRVSTPRDGIFESKLNFFIGLLPFGWVAIAIVKYIKSIGAR